MDHSSETFPAVLMHCTIDFSPFVWDLFFSLASFGQKIDIYFFWFVLFCPQAVFRRRPQLGRLYTHRVTRTGESLRSVRLLLSYRQSLCRGRKGWSHRWSGQYIYLWILKQKLFSLNQQERTHNKTDREVVDSSQDAELFVQWERGRCGVTRCQNFKLATPH